MGKTLAEFLDHPKRRGRPPKPRPLIDGPEHRNQIITQLAAAADAIAVDKLSAFVRRAWHIINPGRKLIWNWHMDVICDHLEAVTDGRIKKLLINLPPGYSKTSIITICWPAWEWLRRPELRYLCASYSDALSAKAGLDRRTILQSDWYAGLIAHAERVRKIQPWSVVSATSHHVRSSRGGEMLATSVGGQGTGRHADRNIIDDPIKAEDIYTVELENHVRWFRETLTSRVTSVTDSAFVIVMQRLHGADLSGSLRDDPDWCVVRLPAEWDESFRYVNRLGWTDPRTEPGDPLFPARFPREYLEKRKGPFGLGSIAFAAQEQQDPVSGKGHIFQREWFRFWWQRPGNGDLSDLLPDDVDRVVGSWDMTFKGGAGSDFVVGQVWAQKGACFYLLDQTRARLNFVETEAAFIALRSKWHMCTRWLIEEKANGAAIISRLRGSIAGIVPVVPTESKEARAGAISSFVQSGNVWLPPVSRPWVQQLVEEMVGFPLSAYDDQVDALTQAVKDMSMGRASPFTLPKPMEPRRHRDNPLPESLRGQDDAIARAERDARGRVKSIRPPPGLVSGRIDPTKKRP